MTEPYEPAEGMEECPQCDGTGEVWDEYTGFCDECDGTGEVESLW